jgi:hypothetical protein
MADPCVITDPDIRYQKEAWGATRVQLVIEGRSVSSLFIIPFTLRIGAATVRMDGIGGVETEKECRQRGYARQVLEATVQHMEQGDAAVSMLYGIPGFYSRFGYATAGPEHYIDMPGPFDGAVLPPGWRVRPFIPTDLPALGRLYDQNTARGVGAAVRSLKSGPWAKLVEPEGKGAEGCRVVEAPDGQVRAYAWRARWHWYVGMIERHEPDAMVIAEAMADGPAAADAILSACEAWAAEESETRAEPVNRVILGLPPEGPVAAAAMYEDAHLMRRYQRCGGSMARVVDVERLLEALRPELAERLRAAGSPFSGSLRLRTEIGEATLAITPAGITVQGQGHAAVGSADAAAEMMLRLPQTTLARLALGVFPPEDLLARLEEPPGVQERELVAILFPLRHPHMYLTDRF